jgi:hypothetical protein
MKFWIDPYIYSAMSSKDKELINKFKFDDFRNKDRFKDIKDVYISITKAKKVNLNRSSMLMASFFPRRICQQGCICPGQDCQDIFTFLPNGFVCSGDYPISTPEISKTI